MMDNEFSCNGYATCAGGVVLVGEYGAVGAEPHPRSLLRATAPRWALGSGLEIGGGSWVIYFVLRKWWCYALR